MRAQSKYGSKKILLILILLIGGLSASAFTFGDTILAPLGLAREGSFFSNIGSDVPTVVDAKTVRIGAANIPGLTVPAMRVLQSAVDVQGADDEPGQKDLNALTVDYGASGATTIAVTWNWDDTSTSGNNTRDGGALFDTDGDGNANFVFYITVATNGTRVNQVYICTQDAKPDRCTGPTLAATFTSTSSVSVVANTDPFGVQSSPDFDTNHDTGNTCKTSPACYTSDTVAVTSLKLSDFGNVSNTAIDLLNVCSYPSGEPNSDPSDCVLAINPGTLTLVKVVDNGGLTYPELAEISDFPLSIDGNPTTSGASVDVAPGPHTIAEVPVNSPFAYTVGTWTCNNNQSGTGGSASFVVNVADGADVTCTITNTLASDPNPSLLVSKVDDGDIYDSLGDVIDYTITVTNNGDVTLNNIAVTDPNASGLDCNPNVAGNQTTGFTLAPAGVLTCTASHTVNQADLDAGSYYNAACADDGLGGAEQACDDVTTPGNPSKSINLNKVGNLVDTNGDGRASAGDTINYAFTVTNTGSVTLTNVTLADTIGGVTVSGGPIASLAPGAVDSTTFTGSKTLSQANIDAGTFTNTATACGTPPSGAPVCDPDDDTQTFPAVKTIDLQKVGTLDMTVVAPSNRADAGDKINYAFTVTNTGNVTLTNVTLADTIGGVTVSGGPIASLAPGAVDSTTFTGSKTLSQGDINAGTFTNTATACGTPPVGIAVCDPDDDTQTLGPQPSLSIVKTADRTSYNAVNQVINYTITATNTGNTTLTNVTVTDPNVANLSCTPTNGSNSVIPGGTVVCTASHTVTQADIDAGHYANTACVDAATATQACDDLDIPGDPKPDVSVLKTGNGPINAGQTAIFTITVSSIGNATANGVTLTDTLPGGVAWTDDSADCTITTGVLNCSFGNLAPGATRTVNVSGATDAGDCGPLSNSATVAATNEAPNTGANNTSNTSIFVACPALSLDKTSNTTVITAIGQVINYSYLVSNTGNVTLTGITLVDDKLGSITCPKTSLAVGESMTCTASYTVQASDLSLTNLVNVATADSDQTNPGVDDTVSIPVQPPALKGHLMHTGVTCSDFLSNNPSDELEFAEYVTKAGKVNNVAPGVMFYYGSITAPSSSFTYNLTQSNDAGWKVVPVQGVNQIILYTASCGKLNMATSFNSAGTATINATGLTQGATYVVGIKYSLSGLSGQAVAPPLETATYSFAANINGNAVASSEDSIPISAKQ